MHIVCPWGWQIRNSSKVSFPPAGREHNAQELQCCLSEVLKVSLDLQLHPEKELQQQKETLLLGTLLIKASICVSSVGNRARTGQVIWP